MSLESVKQRYEAGLKELLQAYVDKEKAEENCKRLKNQLASMESAIQLLEKEKVDEAK